ncbi:FHA domain protein [Thalassoglobus neptunius]|uniref:FHA domain protein n=1 Tax=Thalassoglobus neptunius TaxID=1938619 RepID=A0A5C5VPL3_9PLAN|nr:FHA domain-containing protein [Thalassoglobus neptunius]TWT40050.1 FHA domain protein [Thalassoglobus neptunius]
MNSRSRETGNESMVITIGRAADNTVVIDQSNVSSHHARITINGDQILLDDLGSTNGTSVGSLENKVSRKEIGLDETVYFGSSPFPVRELLAKASDTTVSQPDPEPNRPTTSKSHRVGLIIPIAGLGILLMTAWFIASRPDELKSSTKDLANNPELNVPEDVEPALLTEFTLQERIDRALFLVVVANPEQDIAFRVGSCFAIEEHNLATSGTVVRAVREFQRNGYSDLYLFNPKTSEKLAVSAITVHPRYEQATDAVVAAQRAYDEIIDHYELEPPPIEDIEKVEAELLKHKKEAFKFLETQTVYDVAMIRSQTSLKHWLTLDSTHKNLRPNLKLIVYGLAFDVEDPYFDPEENVAVSQLHGRVQQSIHLKGSIDGRLIASADSEHRDSNFLGAPISRESGEVVAIYSRPTPPSENAELPDQQTGFEAPLVAPLVEISAPTFDIKVSK